MEIIKVENRKEAILKQIELCKSTSKIHCGYYTTSLIDVKRAFSKITLATRELKDIIEYKIQKDSFSILFKNGSFIKILPARTSYARGRAFNSVIIDEYIDDEFIKNEILPTAKISPYTVYQIQNKILRGAKAKMSIIGENNENNFKKEYEGCWTISENSISNWRTDNAFSVKDINKKRILLYNALGIPENKIKSETEFINRTKEKYLNIKGEYENEKLGFHNEINIHLFIDTNIYKGYKVIIENGIVKVVLYEIENEEPELIEYKDKDIIF